VSDPALRELTGYVRGTCQRRWLHENGIRHFVNALGKVRVPRDAVTALPAARQSKPTEPDFSKVRKVN
jgi:sarcosine oxidase delta subunit